MKFKILLLITLVCLQCNKEEKTGDKHNNRIDSTGSIDCDSKNKVDLLIKDILRRKYICTIFGVDTNAYNPNRFNYMVSDGLIEPGKTFYASVKPPPSFKGLDSIRVISIERDSIKDKEIGLFYFKLKQTNSDTTFVKIVVDYILLGRIPASESTFDYYFDGSRCKWIVKDSTFDRY